MKKKEKKEVPAGTPEPNGQEDKKKKSGLIVKILMVVCLGVFVFSGYKLFTIWNGNHQIEQETNDLSKFITQPAEDGDEKEGEPKREVFNPDWEALQQANPAVVAWIIVPGCDISYPVVQGVDNSFYLNHTYTGQPNNMGSIFMDADVPAALTADNTLIYGHSVDIGGMFTNLKNFTNRDFFSEHPYFWLLTPGQNYKCMILSLFEGNDSGAVYTTSFGDFRTEVLEQVEQESVFYRKLDTDNRNFVTLSTCNLDYGFSSDQRYVLMAVLEKYDKPIYTDEAN